MDGILLTHAHIGHYAGLMYLGREALGARGVPVYATPRMAALPPRPTGPGASSWPSATSSCARSSPGRAFALAEGLHASRPSACRTATSTATPWPSASRARSRRLLYVPDIDKWEKWDRRLEDEVAAVEVALLDGTFESETELPGRSLLEIPHPLVGETAARLAAPRHAEPTCASST